MGKLQNDLTFMTNKPFILALMKDDIKNTKLVASLDAIGLDSGKYYLDLGETVVAMLGLGDKELDERLWEEYSDNLSEIVKTDIFENGEKLDLLAQALFLNMIEARTKIQASSQFEA